MKSTGFFKISTADRRAWAPLRALRRNPTAAAITVRLFSWVVLLASASTSPSSGIPESDSAVLVPFDGSGVTVPNLRTFFTDEEMAAWKEYSLKKLWVHLIGLGSILLFYLVLILTGFNGGLKRLAQRVATGCYAQPALLRVGKRWPLLARMVKIPERLFGGRQWLEVLFYCLFFLLLIRFFFLPQHFYRSYWFDLQYGLSNYSLRLWIIDYAKGLLLGTLLFALMVFGVYGLMARVGRRWWLLLWAGVSIAIFGYVAVAPYGSHLYSHFRPLEEGELRDRLEALATRTGLRLEDILVVDASRRTKRVNAYLSGSGPSERIVLYDTLLDAFTPREITMILAHELAHWKEPDEALSYGAFSLTVFAVLALAHSILIWGSRVRRFHYAAPTDVAGLPVLLLTFFVAFQILGPVNLYWKRAREIKADRKSLELVCDPEAFMTTHAKLARLNFSDVDPHPLYVIFFFSHPPFLKRVQTALAAGCTKESQPPGPS
jgi:Zn-dependent protease with chaperone function